MRGISVSARFAGIRWQAICRRHAVVKGLSQLVAKFCRILMSVNLNGVLDGGFQKFGFGICADGHRAVHGAWKFPTVDELASHLNLPVCFPSLPKI